MMEDVAGCYAAQNLERNKEEAADMHDAFALLDGIGERQVYRIDLMKTTDKLVTRVEARGADKRKCRTSFEEEEAVGDVDDPGEMMGGMCEEEAYKATLVVQDATAVEKAEEQETEGVVSESSAG